MRRLICEFVFECNKKKVRFSRIGARIIVSLTEQSMHHLVESQDKTPRLGTLALHFEYKCETVILSELYPGSKHFILKQLDATISQNAKYLCLLVLQFFFQINAIENKIIF